MEIASSRKALLTRKWVLDCGNLLSLRGAERRSNLDRLSVVGAGLLRFARNDRVCRIDRFIQAGSVINSQRLCHLGVTIEAHNGKAGGRAKPSPIESFDLLFPCRLPAEPDGCRRKRVLSLCYSEFFGNEGNEFRAGWQFFSLSLPA